MRLGPKLVVFILPIILIAIVGLGRWTYLEAKQGLLVSNYRYMRLALDDVFIDQVKRRSDLVIKADMQGIAYFVEKYKSEARQDIQASSQRFQGDFFVFSPSDVSDIKGHNADCPLTDEQARVVMKDLKESEDMRFEGTLKGSTLLLCEARYFAEWDWVVGYTIPEKTTEQYLKPIYQATILAVFVVGLALTLLIGFLTRRFITNPIGILERSAQDIAAGNSRASILINSRDELGALARSLEDMVEEIQLRETDLTQSRAILLEAERLADLGAWNWDIQSDSWTCSDNWLRIHGLSNPNLSLHEVLKIAHPDDLQSISKAVSKSVEQGLPFSLEYRVIRPDTDEIVHIHKNGEVELDSFGNAVRLYGAAQNITRRKEMEQRLALAQKLESVGQLASGIAHEINTPLQYIGSNLKFMKGAFSELEEAFHVCKQGLQEYDDTKAAEAVSIVKEALELLQELKPASTESIDGVNQVSTIVQAMKRFAHPDVNSIRAIDLNETVKNTVAIAKNEWKYVSDVELDLAEDLPYISCNHGEINQVLLNLLVNASHAISQKVEGSPGKGRITISTQHHNNELVLSVKDTGCGIPEGIKNRIYDPFFTTKEIGKGTGQGLAIAYAIIEKHNGSINMDSTEGEGTTFTVRLPL
ncbi:ATP-binding protein [Maridesulfovibrio frigidus]|uniref:ATP-binding protein n=1 Tax=Maridesulfovibrio frigidus TaxID=340956 RepID=UPI000691EA1F|nr:ATP-binding protein [Maridesulfovibrio frigidus]